MEMDITHKIAEVFMSNQVVLFTKDIAPIIMEKYQYEFMEDITYTTIEEDIARGIEEAHSRGVDIIGIPKFGDNPNSSVLVIIDFKYRCTHHH